jgi:hypothetical protein
MNSSSTKVPFLFAGLAAAIALNATADINADVKTRPVQLQSVKSQLVISEPVKLPTARHFKTNDNDFKSAISIKG